MKRMLQRAAASLNIFNQCRSHHLRLWECPQFIFLIIGIVIIGSLAASFLIASNLLRDPTVIIALEALLAVFLLTLNYLITNSFERIAEASEMKTKFITIVSHQLRAPLSSLRWSLEAFRSAMDERELSEDEREYVDIITNSGTRMRELISNLLTASTIQEDRLHLGTDRFSLKEVAEVVIDKYNAYAEDQRVQVSLNAPPDVPPVAADRIRTREVMDNLLENAIEYSNTPADGQSHVTITITPAENGMVQCSVEDEGRGIPREEQKYIFSRFYRGDGATHEEPRGAGLGLYIARELVRRMGGNINFTSTAGVGSTFWFTLPAAQTQ